MNQQQYSLPHLNVVLIDKAIYLFKLIGNRLRKFRNKEAIFRMIIFSLGSQSRSQRYRLSFSILTNGLSSSEDNDLTSKYNKYSYVLNI